MFFNRVSKNKTIYNVIIITAIFLISVLLRVPNIKETQYLGKGHEWITGHVLLTNSIWFQEGGSNYHWAPVYTYNYKHDKTHPLFDHLIDNNGNRYYASYPPFVFYFPYAIFKLTGFEPNVLGLRVINLFIHFVSACLLYLLILYLAGKSIKTNIYIPAIVGFTLYVFNTVNLWVNGNLFFADTLVQPIFIAIVYLLVVRCSKAEEKLSNSMIVLFCLLSFLAVYTEWIGVFILFISFIVLLFFIKKNKSLLILLIGMPVSGMLAIITMCYQYSLISGWDNYLAFIIKKYMQRSGATELSLNNFSIDNPVARDALKNYCVDGFLPVFQFFGLILLVALIILIIKRKYYFNKNFFIAITLSTIPVVLHIILLFNFNSWHSFSIHKLSFPLILLSSVVLIFIFNKVELYGSKTTFLSVSFILIAITSLACYKSYTNYVKQVNPTYNFKVNKIVGDAIQKYASPNDAVFASLPSCPELMFYSKRNPFSTKTIEQSFEYMRLLKNANSAIFIETSGQKVTKIYRLNEKNEATILWNDL